VDFHNLTEILMHTKDKLADALQGVGLTRMADRAREGYYHDFLSPLDLPEITLVNDLNIEALQDQSNREAICALRDRVIAGDYDASNEESEEWAKSEEAQEAFRRLLKDNT
jgi:hypothetical protein